MSRLGFDKVIKNLESLERQFLKGGMELARQEFKKNFDTQSSSESGEDWAPVKRKVPPPILYKTGELMRQAIKNGTLKYYPGKVILTIDPSDRFGNHYASFHQNGEGREQREYVTQSNDLTTKQKTLLLTLADRAFL